MDSASRSIPSSIRKITNPEEKGSRKKSPSTLRRNAARKKKLLEEKKNINSTPQPFLGALECDFCDFKARCIVALRKHTHKEHTRIPQVEVTSDKEAQSKSNESKETSTQTELTDLKEA